MLRPNVSGNRRGRGVSPVGGRTLRQGRRPPRRSSRSVQGFSDNHLTADWHGDFGGSERSSTYSAHHTLYSFRDEATQYTSVDTLFAPTLPIGITPPPPASVSDEGSFLQTFDPADTQEPFLGQDADVATVEAISFRSMGVHFAETSLLDVAPESFPGQALRPAPHGTPGSEEMLLLDEFLEQPETSEPFGSCEQSGPSAQPMLPEQLVPSQYRHNSNPDQILGQDALRRPPWNAYHQSNYLLRPPLSDFSTGAFPQESFGPAATHSRFPPPPSSQGSQPEGSLSSMRCHECGKGLGSLKALHRHQATVAVHQDDEDGFFVCKCGSTTKRKDNFKSRHFKNCPKKHLHSASDVYTCICDYKDGSSTSMEQHFKSCPRQNKPGRPSRSASSPQGSSNNRLIPNGSFY